jgi:hypothetical protein
MNKIHEKTYYSEAFYHVCVWRRMTFFFENLPHDIIGRCFPNLLEVVCFFKDF